MQKFLFEILNYILSLKKRQYCKKLKKYADANAVKGNNACHKASVTLDLSVESKSKKAKINSEVREIVEKCAMNPGKILNVIKKKGTAVYRINFADKILGYIGEKEGFIPPLSGFRALYLNFVINFILYKKILFCFETEPMFVLKPCAPDIHALLYQLHLWYAYKSGLSGYDEKTRRKFSAALNPEIASNVIAGLKVGEIYALQEAIARDAEAIEFVLDFSKEFEGAKKVINKINSGQSASV